MLASLDKGAANRRRTTRRQDEELSALHQLQLAIGGSFGQSGVVAILLTFLLGMGNFALHKAVLESRHPLLGQMPWFRVLGGKLSLGMEFLVLLGALLLVANDQPGWGWAYLGYSLLNAITGWLILSRRI